MKAPTRRHILRGAGVALALPWLESLAPRPARGQAAPARLRFVPIYFPLGPVAYWKPTGTGVGDAWKLSPILEPLAALKDRVTVLRHVDQTAYGRIADVVPGNGLLTGSFLTGAKCARSFAGGGITQNGISIDQRVAQTLLSPPPLPSLQLGLSTLNASCDGTPCAYSRSISWKDPTTPLFKLVSPTNVFDLIVTGGVSLNERGRRADRQSVLDYVMGNTTSVQRRLGRSDRQRMDQFLTAVRDLEKRVQATQFAGCGPGTRPTLSAGVDVVPPGYDRNVHADVMIDLIVMALSCDATRVVSFMLDDARSDFSYSFLTEREFTATGSTTTTKKLAGNPIGFANSGNTSNGWATVNHWFVSKLAALCGKMAAIPDGAGATLLDNSVVWFGSGQVGESGAIDLPVLYVGGGGGRLKTGRAIDFPAGAASQSLSNVYLTFLRHVFGAQDLTFGDSTGVVPELIA